jgi:hypothetical protein
MMVLSPKTGEGGMGAGAVTAGAVTARTAETVAGLIRW